MIRNLCLLLLVLFSLQASAQVLSGVDFDDVKAKTTDKGSRYHHPKLKERILALDTTLTREDFWYAYFGQVFDEDYDAYDIGGSKDKLREHFENKEYDKAIAAGKEVLKANPLDMDALRLVAYSHLGLEDKATAKLYFRMNSGLLHAILSSGDGLTPETAWVVTSPHHEYVVFSVFGIEQHAQALIYHGDRKLDLQEVDPKTLPEDWEKTDKLYFDVTWSFIMMAKMFNFEEEKPEKGGKKKKGK